MSLERQLLELEQSHLRSGVRSSPESMRELLAEEFVEFGSSGRVFDRTAVMASISDQADFGSRVDDFVVCRLVPDVALTTYRLSAWTESGGPVRVTLRSSVWVKRSGRWRLVFHQGTVASE
jgi:glyoxylase I family protein